MRCRAQRRIFQLNEDAGNRRVPDVEIEEDHGNAVTLVERDQFGVGETRRGQKESMNKILYLDKNVNHFFVVLVQS